VGLRPEFHPTLHALLVRAGGPLIEGLPDFFEIILENYLGRSQLALDNLRHVAQRFPLVGHGVSLNLLGADALDLDYLKQVKALISEFSLPYVSDHLCWTASHGVTHHDLLPVPYTRDLVAYAAERAAFVQRFLGVPFGLENLSSYVGFLRDEMSEWEFYTQVIEQAGCWAMLDINNVYVSSVNQGFDVESYLSAVDWSRVLQVHIAGHSLRDDGVLHDTHDQPVTDAVWELYRYAWSLGGPFPTLLERDGNMPRFSEVMAEANRARDVRGEAVK
jgi:uncharacterized protein